MHWCVLTFFLSIYRFASIFFYFPCSTAILNTHPIPSHPLTHTHTHPYPPLKPHKSRSLRIQLLLPPLHSRHVALRMYKYIPSNRGNNNSTVLSSSSFSPRIFSKCFMPPCQTRQLNLPRLTLPTLPHGRNNTVGPCRLRSRREPKHQMDVMDH
ncbi:hypothetical protein F4775DRAFT_490606 [Biscogniauxia sp. FL1348]|nr:hypothetical protein F4775DRAFT_490606 [Biscogniauxia sp. FL1348]